MFLRTPNRLNTFRTPECAVLAHFGPLGPPAGPGDPAGPRDPAKKFWTPTKNFCKCFFRSKNVFFGVLDGFWTSRAPGDPLGPPTIGHFGPKCPQNGHSGPQERPKKREKHRKYFSSKSLADGSWMVSRHRNRLKTCGAQGASVFGPHVHV